eukprot:4849401-Prymnesium_polylepis.1
MEVELAPTARHAKTPGCAIATRLAMANAPRRGQLGPERGPLDPVHVEVGESGDVVVRCWGACGFHVGSRLEARRGQRGGRIGLAASGGWRTGAAGVAVDGGTEAADRRNRLTARHTAARHVSAQLPFRVTRAS